MKKFLQVLLVLAIVGGCLYYFFGRPVKADLPESDNYTPVVSHYSYDALTTDEAREVYEKIERNAYKQPDKDRELCSFDDVDETQFYLGFKAFRDDHPDAFWLSMGYSRTGLKVTSCNVLSRYPKEELKEMKDDFKTNLEEFLDSVPGGLSDEELEEYTHDYLMDCCEYDDEALHDYETLEDETSERLMIAGSAYGALNGKAVCEGYAEAYQLLLNRVGVDCVVIQGTAEKPENYFFYEPTHAWNAVKNGSTWQMTDVTWDDGQSDIRRYYNLSIAEMMEDHDARAIDMDTVHYSMFFGLVGDGNLFLPA